MTQLKRLDQLLADLGGSADVGKQSRGTCTLMLEHLRAARRDLLGAMPGEYSLSLREAQKYLGCISDKTARLEIGTRLQTLIGV